jgi:putative spermidine/putrescine transport system permease protein
MRLSQSSRISLRIVVAIVLAFIYIPLIVIFIYAFNSSNLLEWPPPGLTLHWFPEALKNTDARDAFVTSL